MKEQLILQMNFDQLKKLCQISGIQLSIYDLHEQAMIGKIFDNYDNITYKTIKQIKHES